jgi:hypothetical protein
MLSKIQKNGSQGSSKPGGFHVFHRFKISPEWNVATREKDPQYS